MMISIETIYLIKVSWFITFVSVVFLNVDVGLVIGVFVSNLMVVVKDQFYQMRYLSKYDETTDFIDNELITNVNYPSIDSNVFIFKPQGAIYFANCDNFQKKLFKMCGYSPIERLMDQKLKKEAEEEVDDSLELEEKNRDPDIILDFSGVNYVDTNGVKMITQLVGDFDKVGVTLYICEPQGKLKSLK